MKTIQAYLPVFCGFYETSFDSDNAINMEIDYLSEENPEIDCADIKWDYKEYQDRVAEACVSSVWNELKSLGYDIDIEFEAVYSPRFYNFENDVINCTYKITDESFTELIDYLQANIEDFNEYVTEKYSSRSGFISFFETDLDVWFDEYLIEGNDKFERSFVGALDFILKNEDYDMDIMLESVSNEIGYIEYKLPNEAE